MESRSSRINQFKRLAGGGLEILGRLEGHSRARRETRIHAQTKDVEMSRDAPMESGSFRRMYMHSTCARTDTQSDQAATNH